MNALSYRVDAQVLNTLSVMQLQTIGSVWGFFFVDSLVLSWRQACCSNELLLLLFCCHCPTFISQERNFKYQCKWERRGNVKSLYKKAFIVGTSWLVSSQGPQSNQSPPKPVWLGPGEALIGSWDFWECDWRSSRCQREKAQGSWDVSSATLKHSFCPCSNVWSTESSTDGCLTDQMATSLL